MENTFRPAPTRSLPGAAAAGYAAFASFVILTVLFAGVIPAAGPHPAPALLFTLAVVGVAFHVALFPVVAALPAPDWGKAAGYGWLVIDIATNVMGINGVADGTTTAMRLGGHIAAAMWIASAAAQARGRTRLVGLGLATALAAYSFVAPWTGFMGFLPAIMLMIVWLWLSARRLGATGL